MTIEICIETLTWTKKIIRQHTCTWNQSQMLSDDKILIKGKKEFRRMEVLQYGTEILPLGSESGRNELMKVSQKGILLKSFIARDLRLSDKLGRSIRSLILAHRFCIFWSLLWSPTGRQTNAGQAYSMRLLSERYKQKWTRRWMWSSWSFILMAPDVYKELSKWSKNGWPQFWILTLLLFWRIRNVGEIR